MKAAVIFAVLCLGATLAQARIASDEEHLSFFGRSLMSSRSTQGCKVKSNGGDRSEGCGEVCSTSGGLCASGSSLAAAYADMNMDCFQTCQSCCSKPEGGPKCEPYKAAAPSLTASMAFGDLWEHNCRGECGLGGKASPSPAKAKCFADCVSCGNKVKSSIGNYCNLLNTDSACAGLEDDIKDDVAQVVYQVCNNPANANACSIAEKKKKKKKKML